VRLRDFLICDHFTVIEGGKPAYIGVFDTLRTTQPRKSWEPIPLVPACVCAFIGVAKHDARSLAFMFRLVDADGKPVGEWTLEPIPVAEPEDGTETAGLGFLRIGPNTTVPDAGDYTWEVHVNGQRLGAFPFWVRDHAFTVRPA
jgi:hypothetical protein